MELRLQWIYLRGAMGRPATSGSGTGGCNQRD
jgi:hypothetical protein